MLQYAIRRLLGLIPLLLGVSLIVFGMVRLIPGDVVDQMLLESQADAQVMAQTRRYLGLDRPLPVQYWDWVTGIARGDLGRSLVTRRPVADELRARLPATLELTVAAMLLSLALALPLGVLAALHRNSWIDNLATVVALAGISMPSFALGTILILVFAVRLHLFPAAGHALASEDLAGHLRNLALPAITLGAALAAVVMRMTRSAMLEVLAQDYVRTARAKGLRGRTVVWTHALRNGLIAVVTVVGIQVGHLLGGSVIVEQIFSWPGIGAFALDAISRRDYPVVQAVVLLITTLFVLVNLVVDLLYGLIDPRIKYGTGG